VSIRTLQTAHKQVRGTPNANAQASLQAYDH
jgi:hypothetical protein